jgi:peptidyl-prolyl cis-trans isomerase D
MAEQKFADLRDQLANITYENSDSLQPAAKQLKLSIQTTGIFTKDGAKKGIASNPRFVAAAFSDEVLNQHDNSDPIDLSDNSVVVLRVKHHIPATVKSFVQVKSSIINKLRQQTAAKQATDLGNTVIQELQAKKSLNNVAKLHQLTWNNVTNASRHAGHIDTNILNAAFYLSRGAKVSAQGLSLPSNNYAVVVLDKVQEGSAQKLTAAQWQAFQRTATQKLGLLEYQLYATGLLQKAKVKKFAEAS